MSAIEQLAVHCARPDPLSGPQRERVALHVLDTIGALLAASRTPEGRMLLRLRGQAGDMPQDIATLCAVTRLSEIDDIHLASMTTAGSIVIPAALVIAANRSADADAFAQAIVAGYEAMVRLNLALDGPGILYRGIWPTYFAAPVGTAAVAARLFGLDARQTAHALALALTYAAPGVGHHNAPTTARWVAAGHAARNGVMAAEAAQAGFTADLALLDGSFFPNVYGITPKLEALSGERDVLADISFKPWCAARQTMAATQALKEIIADGVAPESITSVHASVLPPHQRMIDHGVKPGDRASYLTGLSYNMAAAAVAPELADVLSPIAGQVPDAVHAFMDKITIAADESLLADYPRIWPAHVVMTTASGRHEKRIEFVPGDPSRPFSADEVRAKFRRFVTPVLGADETEAILRATLPLSPKLLFEALNRRVG
jgi:2-methylcitrate dehydratase PrpD